jgi:glycosyltransferase involved in cell wall biosynthesis
MLSRADPDDAHLAALMFCRRTGVPWVANWNDPLPWPRFPPPYGDGPQAVMPWWYERYLRALARYGSWYTFPCERMRHYMMGYLPPGMAPRSSVIPHVAMRRFVVPPRQHEGFVVCHVGSLRRPRDPRVLLEGVRRFAERLAPGHAFSLRFIVEKPDEALAAARAARAEHLVRVDPPRPYDAMPEALAEADVLVVVEAPLAEGIFLPSKFVDYVQSGRPILALSPREGTLPDLLRNHGGGLAVDGQSPEAVADALVRLYDAWRQGTLDAKFGSAHLFDQFSEERVAALYADLFAHVAASPAHGTGA